MQRLNPHIWKAITLESGVYVVDPINEYYRLAGGPFTPPAHTVRQQCWCGARLHRKAWGLVMLHSCYDDDLPPDEFFETMESLHVPLASGEVAYCLPIIHN